MAVNRNTFIRFAAAKLRWALGEYSHRLTSAFAAMSADAIADATRQLCRWTMPLYDTPVDALPFLLRNYGLPSYRETYAQTIARLRVPVDTHATAGSKAQLEAELERAGFVGATIVTGADSSFWIQYGNGITAEYGTGATYGDGAIYGAQVSPTEAHNAIRLMNYFRPAREFWRGFQIVP